MKMISAALFGALALASLSGWAQSAGFTDPQIAAIVATANQVDIDDGRLAESTTKSKESKRLRNAWSPTAAASIQPSISYTSWV